MSAEAEAGAGAGTEGLGATDIAAMFISAVIVGIAVSPIMVDIGTEPWVVMAAVTFAWSGTGEVAYASVIADGGGTVPAVVAAMLVSSRFSLLAMSLKDKWSASILERIGMYQYASEVAVANAIDYGNRFGPKASRRVFWQLATPMATGWFIGSGLGLILGNVVGDTRQIGLDVVFPASFIGAVVNGLRRRDSAVAIFGGMAAAVGLASVLPAGLPILVAALAAVVALAVRPHDSEDLATAAGSPSSSTQPDGGQ